MDDMSLLQPQAAQHWQVEHAADIAPCLLLLLHSSLAFCSNAHGIVLCMYIRDY
jgi:hypothetical protein